MIFRFHITDILWNQRSAWVFYIIDFDFITFTTVSAIVSSCHFLRPSSYLNPKIGSLSHFLLFTCSPVNILVPTPGACANWVNGVYGINLPSIHSTGLVRKHFSWGFKNYLAIMNQCWRENWKSITKTLEDNGEIVSVESFKTYSMLWKKNLEMNLNHEISQERLQILQQLVFQWQAFEMTLSHL